MRENASRIAFQIPKGLNLSAQGWIAGEKGGRSYPGFVIARVHTNPERVASALPALHPRSMPQSLSKIIVHTVFSTKDRRPFLRDAAVREELHRYLGGILNQLDCQPMIVG